MPHLTAQQATEQYKVSIRTLRTLIAGLTDQQRTKYLLIKGKQHLISTELLNQHYQPRTGEQVQNKGAKMQTHNTSPSDAPPTDTASDAKQVQTELIAHLKNEVAQLHSRFTDRHTGTETEHHNRRAVYLVYCRFSIWFVCSGFSGL
jgi:hypothetical protein